MRGKTKSKNRFYSVSTLVVRTKGFPPSKTKRQGHLQKLKNKVANREDTVKHRRAGKVMRGSTWAGKTALH